MRSALLRLGLINEKRPAEFLAFSFGGLPGIIGAQDDPVSIAFPPWLED
jgi:hypothetical protein